MMKYGGQRPRWTRILASARKQLKQQTGVPIHLRMSLRNFASIPGRVETSGEFCNPPVCPRSRLGASEVSLSVCIWRTLLAVSSLSFTVNASVSIFLIYNNLRIYCFLAEYSVDPHELNEWEVHALPTGRNDAAASDMRILFL